MSQIKTNSIVDLAGGNTAQINGVAPTVDNLRGKNKIINGNFDVWQRGTSGFGSNAYNADRWLLQANGTANTINRGSFTLGQTDVPNEPEYYISCAVTAGSASGDYSSLRQRIESVKTLAGQSATLSFYAKADAAKDISVVTRQYFGTTGGSGSTYQSPTTCSLTTSWQKFEITIAINSISGKTLGSTGDDFIDVIFWFDAGTEFNTEANSLGHQSGTFDIAQVQLEAGSVATSFETRSYGEELALCQRYFETSLTDYANKTSGARYYNYGTADANGKPGCMIPFAVNKRTIPTMSYWNAVGIANEWTYSRSGATGSVPVTNGGQLGTCASMAYLDATGAGIFGAQVVSGRWAADAEL